PPARPVDPPHVRFGVRAPLVARTAVATAAAVAWPARRRAPRALDAGRALPRRRPPHPRLPGRGRLLPGEPDPAVHGAAGRAALGPLRAPRPHAPRPARRLSGSGRLDRRLQLARAAAAPARPARRDAPYQGNAPAGPRSGH